MTEGPTQTKVIVYTDGACDPNPGPGGWAALLLFGGHRKTMTGFEPRTTNNRMELQAIIEALQALNQPCQIRLHTDSEYVQKGVTQYLGRWKARGWLTADKQPVANRDLWEKLDTAMQRHRVEWLWVKGHAGDPHNEEVDRLSVGMIPRAPLPLAETGATHVFAAASCLGASGPGAWAVVTRAGENTRELSGREEQTSANRLHLMAVVRGLEAAPAGGMTHIYTPSDYVAQGAERWVKGWARNGWRTKEGQPVKHAELWQALQRASHGRPVRWHSLKTEAVRPEESKRADSLARAAAR
jgi:ribonuclease HI